MPINTDIIIGIIIGALITLIVAVATAIYSELKDGEDKSVREKIKKIKKEYFIKGAMKGYIKGLKSNKTFSKKRKV